MAWLKPAAVAMTVMFSGTAAYAAECANPKQMDGFKTCANVELAEKEGALTVYSPEPETNQAKQHQAFMDMFPKIKVTFIRLQAGALYAKLMAERQANVFQPDVLWLSDMTFVLDLQKRGGKADAKALGRRLVQVRVPRTGILPHGAQEQPGRALGLDRADRGRHRL